MATSEGTGAILRDIRLKERIARANGATPAEAGEFFGWEPGRVTKQVSDFEQQELLEKGWTKQVLEDVAGAYEEVDRLTRGHGNPSAAGRAKQLREIAARFFT